MWITYNFVGSRNDAKLTKMYRYGLLALACVLAMSGSTVLAKQEQWVGKKVVLKEGAAFTSNQNISSNSSELYRERFYLVRRIENGQAYLDSHGFFQAPCRLRT